MTSISYKELNEKVSDKADEYPNYEIKTL